RSELDTITSWARRVPTWISEIRAAIVSVDCCDSSASLRTSSATTAKPRPCSPARAASMAAFSASRLVCEAIPEIVSTIAPTFPLRQRLDPLCRLCSRLAHLVHRIRGGLGGGHSFLGKVLRALRLAGGSGCLLLGAGDGGDLALAAAGDLLDRLRDLFGGV